MRKFFGVRYKRKCKKHWKRKSIASWLLILKLGTNGNRHEPTTDNRQPWGGGVVG